MATPDEINPFAPPTEVDTPVEAPRSLPNREIMGGLALAVSFSGAAYGGVCTLISVFVGLLPPGSGWGYVISVGALMIMGPTAGFVLAGGSALLVVPLTFYVFGSAMRQPSAVWTRHALRRLGSLAGLLCGCVSGFPLLLTIGVWELTFWFLLGVFPGVFGLFTTPNLMPGLLKHADSLAEASDNALPQ